MPEKVEDGEGVSRSFKEWMAQVNAIVIERSGIGALDGADWPSHDTWSSGATPEDGWDEWAEWNDFPLDA